METKNTEKQTRQGKKINPEHLSLGLTVSVNGIPITIDTPETLNALVIGEIPCHGIRITEEFLKLNGFEQKGKKLILKTHGNEISVSRMMGHYRMHIWGEPLHDNFYCPSFEDYIVCVHELQTACRLCRVMKTWIIPESDEQVKTPKA